MEPVIEESSLHRNGDILAILAGLLSNQYAFFAEVSKDWRDAWGDMPKTTSAITTYTSVSQLRWSFDSGLTDPRTSRPMICERITEHCSLDVLRCAHSNGCALLPKGCFKAAARGNLKIIQWAIDNNCGWRDVVCRAAAAGGSLHILKWARANDCPWDSWTCTEAAESGHLDILQ